MFGAVGGPVLATTVLAATALVGAAAVPARAVPAAKPTCRSARVSVAGAAGSARICWTTLGRRVYRASVGGTVRDTAADGKRAALFVHTWDRDGRSSTPRLALATKHGQVRHGSWSGGRVRGGVYVYVCTVDRFNTSYRCSRDG
ncbi:hypothetical protein [Actinomadura atramentaria]|uniref:hypothetical protein n=1 Tax=Actinomadura atramentaria TaxID=1990 RepID=UPI00036C7AF3|nr:hypothetical protein [Actinomadura atramentaria]